MDKGLYIENSVRRKLKLTAAYNSTGAYYSLETPYEARALADKINSSELSEEAVKASDLYLAALIQKYSRHLIQNYLKDFDSLQSLITDEKRSAWEGYLHLLDEHYPAKLTIPADEDAIIFLEKHENLENRLLDGLLLLLQNGNPAFKDLKFLSPDKNLDSSPYRSQLEHLAMLQSGKVPSGWSQNLVFILMGLLNKKTPHLIDQIDLLLTKWNEMIPLDKDEILLAMDFEREDNKIGLPGPGPVEGIDFSFLDDDIAHFSKDSDWMPHVILLAKNAYVWLDQLSKQYKREINTLDKIPGEELDELKERGVTSLWLIGLWERSTASKEIKRICGNSEAEASAYSLKNYDISLKLGGWEAYEELKLRCSERGLRLASDMVPNHTGLDSDWIIDHPEYFISRSDLPYPGYSFEGPNLSSEEEVSLYLEDGYYDQSDAAVVFKRVENSTGEESYIYHGNDGTSMPWNDTAQLDFLNPEVREAIIQQILHVASFFPIIRFDAAMTLARKHIQRLWFPVPGKGGAIPSRSEYAMRQEEFNKLIPEEFWREVVERISIENPDTLLLAEAFWMMEGFFVRNLGMHRVYNSAFMNLLKTEENEEYKKLLKETLDYDPEILQRYVNFMNNPDEDSAIAQYGKGDKYFGICTLLITLPGLPMIGHGQFEGFYEKYGMEYSKAYEDESVDEGLLDRHRKEIFPLMKIRALFAGAKNFHLFDFFSSTINKDLSQVYAFSNSYEGKQSLVVYNNSQRPCEGKILNEVPKAIRNAEGDKTGLEKSSIGKILDLDPDKYILLFDQKSQLWYIHRNKDIIRNGLSIHLNSYQARVFYPIQQRSDDENHRLEALVQKTGGHGVAHLDRALMHADIQAAMHVLNSFFSKKLIETPVMTDLILLLSSDLNKMRRLLNLKNKKRPDRVNTINRKRMEYIILPSIESLLLSPLGDDELFYMALFYDFYQEWFQKQKGNENINYIALFRSLMEHDEFQDWFGINEYRDVTWYDGDKMQMALWWFATISALKLLGPRTDQAFIDKMTHFEDSYYQIHSVLAESAYKVENVFRAFDDISEKP